MRTSSPEPARQTALNLFTSVITKGTMLDHALADSEQYQALDPRDRRFCRRLVTTALRRQGQAKAILKRYVSHPPKGRSRSATLILIMAIVELCWLQGKPHAVVDQAVTLTHAAGLKAPAKLVNAVLRRISDDIKRSAAAIAEEIAEENVAINFPDWIKDRLIEDWGNEEAGRIMAALLTPPALDLSVQGDGEQLAERLAERLAEQLAEQLGGVLLPQGSIRLGEGAPERLPGYEEGLWWVQDAAAALPARLLGDIRGKHIIDACAAPGGKTAQLIAMGARVTAIDISAKRLERLHANLERLRMQAETINADMTAWSPDKPVDGVLIDAPCSASGTIRRRPDILTRTRPPDFTAYANARQAMLKQAIDWLKPGGRLIFATCSLFRIEGENAIALLHADKRLIPDPIHSGEMTDFTTRYHHPEHTVRLMPYALTTNPANGITQGNDGFFIARFRKAD